MTAASLRVFFLYCALVVSLVSSAQKSIDYGNLGYWSCHPAKKDVADSIPRFLLGQTRDSTADVFYIHPTTYLKPTVRLSLNADIEDKNLNKETDNRAVLMQATIFNGSCRVYAPRYRQVHIRTFFMMNTNMAKEAFDTAYADIKGAFEYYLAHENHGRPVIIAGHSQGSMHAIRLLKEFFDGKPLQKQLVCAYVVGWPIKKNEFTSLPIGDSATATGCVVGWRSYRNNTKDIVVKMEGSSICVNPITWRMDTAWSKPTQFKGAIGKDFNELITKDLTAHIEPQDNILWIEVPKEVNTKFGRINNLHILDMNLFWMNIRENVAERIKAFNARR